MIRRITTMATAVLALFLLAAPQAAHADDNPGCGTYTAVMTPEPGARVMMRPPMDNPYRTTGTIVSVDDEQFTTVDRDVAEGDTTRHEYVRYCDTEADALASEWGYWAAWPLAE